MTALLDHPGILHPAELDRIRPRRRLSVLEFAMRHLWIVEGPGSAKEPVRWSPDTFPPQRLMIEAMGDRRWSSVVLLTVPQKAGKTLTMTAGIGHTIAEQRQSAFYCSANANLAGTQWGKKFKPCLMADGELAGLIPENPDHAGKREERKFTNGTSLHFAGADSMANLSGFTCPAIFCDDVQAYPATVQDHGPPAEVAQTRAASFPRDMRTIVLAGTAGMVDDYLAVKLLLSACYLPFVPCLDCGTYQMIEFERFVYDDSSAIEAAADCWMRCANTDCEHEIRFEELADMLREFRWVSMPPGANWIEAPSCETGTVMPDDAAVYPETRRATNACGFWLNGLYWPLGETWADVAAQYVSIAGNPDSMRDFNQHQLARPQKDPEIDEERLKPEQVEGLKVEGHLFGTIPEAAGGPGEVAVTTSIDCQAGYLYVGVRAWRKKDGSSWLVYARTVGRKKPHLTDAEIHHRIVEALDDVYRMDAGGWPVAGADGKQVRKQHSDIILVDAGYFQDTIFGYVAARGGMSGKWRAIRGSKFPAKDPKGMLWPAQPMRSRVGRRTWFEPHVNRAKLMLREILAIPPGQPGAWHLPADMPRDTFRAYAAHMTSEVYDKDRDRWIKQAANHYFDMETYQVCAAVACNVRMPGAEIAAVKVVDGRKWIAAMKGGRR